MSGNCEIADVVAIVVGKHEDRAQRTNVDFRAIDRAVSPTTAYSAAR